MAPPKFKDMAKAAEDLFSDDFGASSNKFTFKSKAANGTNIKVEGARVASGAVSALLETKFTHKPSGVTIKEKWTSKNVVTTELSVKDKGVKGSDATLSANFLPNAGGVSDLKLKTAYTSDKFTSTVDVSAKNVAVSGVFSYCKWLIGAATTYDMGKGAVGGTKVSVGYKEADLAVTSTISDDGKVSGSLFHIPSTGYRLESGVQFGWNRGSGATSFGFAAKYALDKDAYVKAKVNTKMDVALAYVQQVRPGVELALAADVAGNSLSSDQHAVGVHITFDN